jgi:hypothetical protein
MPTPLFERMMSNTREVPPTPISCKPHQTKGGTRDPSRSHKATDPGRRVRLTDASSGKESPGLSLSRARTHTYTLTFTVSLSCARALSLSLALSLTHSLSHCAQRLRHRGVRTGLARPKQRVVWSMMSS